MKTRQFRARRDSNRKGESRLERTFPLRIPAGPKREAKTVKDEEVSSIEEVEARKNDVLTVSFRLSIES